MVIEPAFTAEEAFDFLVSRKDKKLYIPSLGDECTEELLQEHFQKFGEVEVVQILMGPVGDKKRKFGFVTFYENNSLLNALDGPSMHYIQKIDQEVSIIIQFYS